MMTYRQHGRLHPDERRQTMRDPNEKLDDPHALAAQHWRPVSLMRLVGDKLEAFHRMIFGQPPPCTCQTSSDRCPRHG